MSAEYIPRPPAYRSDDMPEQRRFYHMVEWGTINGYEYTRTRVLEADSTDWQPEPPDDSWELNVDRWPIMDEEKAGWTHHAPGILRNPNTFRGPELVAHWRRKQP